MQTLLSALIASLMIGILSGCAGTGKAHSGAPPESIAVIKGHQGLVQSILIQEVDGKRFGTLNVEEAEVLPGTHTISFNYTAPLDLADAFYNATATVDVEAGHIYQIHAEENETTIRYWIEDVTTGQIVWPS